MRPSASFGKLASVSSSFIAGGTSRCWWWWDAEQPGARVHSGEACGVGHRVAGPGRLGARLWRPRPGPSALKWGALGGAPGPPARGRFHVEPLSTPAGRHVLNVT